jgi:hypothetical protein
VLLELEQSSNGPRLDCSPNLSEAPSTIIQQTTTLFGRHLLVVYLPGSHLLAFVHRVMAVGGGGHPQNSHALRPQWCLNFVESDRAIPLVPRKFRGELIRHTL